MVVLSKKLCRALSTVQPGWKKLVVAGKLTALTGWSAALHKLVRSHSTHKWRAYRVLEETRPLSHSCSRALMQRTSLCSFYPTVGTRKRHLWRFGRKGWGCHSVVSNLTGCQAYKWANMLTGVNRSTKIFAELWQQWKLTGSSKYWIKVMVALEEPEMSIT